MLETKSAAGGDLAAAFDGFMRAFEDFKDANDERLGQLERRLSADVVTSDKVDRINRVLDEHKRVVDELALKSARPHLAGPALRSGASLQHKAAFEAYVRNGEDAALRGLESKALSVGTGTDGGYLVPDELERAVNRAVKDVSPIRAIAGIRQVSGSVYRKPFAVTGAESGWVAETAARPETDSPTLAALSEMSFPTMELYAMPAATSALLDDSAVNIDEWIAEEVRDSFAQQEGTAFVTGNGTAKPKGFLDYTKIDNASWVWGDIGFIKTGVNGGDGGSRRQADRPRLHGESRLPRQRHLRLQSRHPGRDPQDEGRRGPLPLAARNQGRRPLHADRLSRRGIGGHAGHRHRQLLGGLRRLPPRLPDRRPRRHPRAARSLQLQALRAVLHH